VSESTLEAPRISAAPEVPDQERAPEAVPWTLRLFIRQHPWWTTAAALAVLSIALLAYAGTRPSFDAYGWLVWGYQTLHGSLDLGGAPSWKPMPLLFTAPFAIFGHYQLRLWMFTSVFVSLAGVVFAGRIAFRLTGGRAAMADAEPFRRAAPIAAAIFAGAAVLGTEDYMHYILSVQTDPMLVTIGLAGLDMFLLGRYRWTLLLGVIAALGRPEFFAFVGPFMVFYVVRSWHRLPRRQAMVEIGLVAVGAAAIVFMWWGVPWITNGRPNISGELAKLSPRALKHNQIRGTISRFGELEYLPIWIAAAVGLVFGGLRRNWVVLCMGAGAVVWVIVEIGFALHGWPGLPRYMFEAASLCCVLAGVAVGWALAELPSFGSAVPRWAGIPLVVILVGVLIPGAIDRVHTERRDLKHERGRAHQIAMLATTTDRIGGARHVQNCGQPVTDVGYVSALAYLYHRNVGHVGGLQQGVEKRELANPALAKVLFYPVTRGGWKVVPWHTRANQVARCHNLRAAYVITRGHPGGVLLHR
jgi:hypothetical protein